MGGSGPGRRNWTAKWSCRQRSASKKASRGDSLARPKRWPSSAIPTSSRSTTSASAADPRRDPRTGNRAAHHVRRSATAKKAPTLTAATKGSPAPIRAGEAGLVAADRLGQPRAVAAPVPRTGEKSRLHGRAGRRQAASGVLSCTGLHGVVLPYAEWSVKLLSNQFCTPKPATTQAGNPIGKRCLVPFPRHHDRMLADSVAVSARSFELGCCGITQFWKSGAVRCFSEVRFPSAVLNQATYTIQGVPSGSTGSQYTRLAPSTVPVAKAKST